MSCDGLMAKRQHTTQRNFHPSKKCRTGHDAGDPRGQHAKRLRLRLPWDKTLEDCVHDQAYGKMDQED